MTDTGGKACHIEQEQTQKQGQDSTPVQAKPLPPITVTAPAIHYTTTQPTAAIVDPDSIFFIAYNNTYGKRILHPLKPEHGLSLYRERPLYEEDSTSSSSTTTVLKLLQERFGEDPASLHLLFPKSYESRQHEDDIKRLKQELYNVSNSLPAIALNIATWFIPDRNISGPRWIGVTASQPETGPVWTDYFLMPIHKKDIRR